MRGLNLDQLRALLEVVERGSFSAAARGLNLTQPAVSLQIRELKRRFGLRLIERLGKRAHATVPGRELIEVARAHFPRVRSRRCGDASFSRGLDRPRACRHDADGDDLPAAADPARGAARSSRHRLARHQRSDADQRREHHPEQDRPRAGEPAGRSAATQGHAAVRGGDGGDISHRHARVSRTRSRPTMSARQNLLVEPPSSAAHALVRGWLSGQAPPSRMPTPLGTVEALKSAVASKSRHGHRAGDIGRHACVRFHRAAVAAIAVAHARSHRASQQAE